MTREEQIASEAKKYYSDDINCYDAFFHGVKWAGKHPANVWHDASEIPNNRDRVLIQFAWGGFDIYTRRTINIVEKRTWCDWCKKGGVIRWTYIKDLLPKGGEE